MSLLDAARAVAFVEREGSPVWATWARFVVGHAGASSVLEAIAPYQRADGGWARIDPDLPADLSLISQTWLGLQWLIWLAPMGQGRIERTVEFLRAHQRLDGCWDEPGEILEHDPPPWMEPGVYANQLWLTAAVGCKLAELDRLGQVHEEITLEFLRKGWTGERFPQFVHPHWMAMPLFHLRGQTPLDYAIRDGCRAFLTDALERGAVDPFDVTAIAYGSALCGRFGEGLLARCLATMEGYQQADGGWLTHYGDQHRPEATVEALMLARRVGRM